MDIGRVKGGKYIYNVIVTKCCVETDDRLDGI